MPYKLVSFHTYAYLIGVLEGLGRALLLSLECPRRRDMECKLLVKQRQQLLMLNFCALQRVLGAIVDVAVSVYVRLVNVSAHSEAGYIYYHKALYSNREDSTLYPSVCVCVCVCVCVWECMHARGSLRGSLGFRV